MLEVEEEVVEEEEVEEVEEAEEAGSDEVEDDKDEDEFVESSNVQTEESSATSLRRCHSVTHTQSKTTTTISNQTHSQRSSHDEYG